MSGGSLDYVYMKVHAAADRVQSAHPASPVHQAFATHLRLVAKALHDMEWVMSGDYDLGDEGEAIRRVITPAMELDAATRAATEARDALLDALALARTRKVCPPHTWIDDAHHGSPYWICKVCGQERPEPQEGS